MPTLTGQPDGRLAGSAPIELPAVPHWQPKLTIRKTTTCALLCACVVFVFSSAYYIYFANALYYFDFSPDGFIGIVIPDTFVYLGEVDQNNPVASIFLSSVKNTIGPSLIWLLVGKSWIGAAAVNALLVFWTLIYVRRLATLFKVPQRKTIVVMALVGLLPTTLYHSVGALKEIPTMLFLTAFLYHYVRGDRWRWLAFALLGALFRYQIGLIVAVFWIADRFGRRALLYLALALLAFAAVYPLVKVGVFYSEATAFYRETDDTEGTLGAAVESIRDTVPVASAFAVLFRLGQTLFEPFITLVQSGGFYQGQSLSIINIAYVLGLALTVGPWMRFAGRMARLIIQSRGSESVRRLYLLCLAYIVPVAGFSFIHHRYLYPVLALILIAAAIPRRYVSAGKIAKFFPLDKTGQRIGIRQPCDLHLARQ